MSKYSFSNPLPTNYIILGLVGVIIAITFFIADRPISGAILGPVSLVLLTARSGIEFDISNKTIRYFKSVFAIKWGKNVVFSDMEYLAVKSGIYTESMGSRGSSHTFTYTLYTLGVSIDGELHELKKSKKEDKIDKLKGELSQAWKIPVH